LPKITVFEKFANFLAKFQCHKFDIFEIPIVTINIKKIYQINIKTSESTDQIKYLNMIYLLLEELP